MQKRHVVQLTDDQRADFGPEGLGVGFEPGQQAGEGVMGRGTGRAGLGLRGLDGRAGGRGGDEELDVVLVRHAGRVYASQATRSQPSRKAKQRSTA